MREYSCFVDSDGELRLVRRVTDECGRWEDWGPAGQDDLTTIARQLHFIYYPQALWQAQVPYNKL